MKRPESIFLVTFFLLFVTIKALGQEPSNFDFQTAYAFGEIDDFPDSIIIVNDISEINPGNNYTILTQLKPNVFSLVFYTGQYDVTTEVIYECKLRIKSNEDLVHLKFCKKESDYIIHNSGTDKNKKLLLRKIIKLPELH